MAAVYGRVYDYEFLSWDDRQHVVDNPQLNPVTPSSVARFWYQALLGTLHPAELYLLCGRGLDRPAAAARRRPFDAQPDRVPPGESGVARGVRAAGVCDLAAIVSPRRRRLCRSLVLRAAPDPGRIGRLDLRNPGVALRRVLAVGRLAISGLCGRCRSVAGVAFRRPAALPACRRRPARNRVATLWPRQRSRWRCCASRRRWRCR